MEATFLSKNWTRNWALPLLDPKLPMDIKLLVFLLGFLFSSFGGAQEFSVPSESSNGVLTITGQTEQKFRSILVRVQGPKSDSTSSAQNVKSFVGEVADGKVNLEIYLPFGPGEYFINFGLSEQPPTPGLTYNLLPRTWKIQNQDSRNLEKLYEGHFNPKYSATEKTDAQGFSYVELAGVRGKGEKKGMVSYQKKGSSEVKKYRFPLRDVDIQQVLPLDLGEGEYLLTFSTQEEESSAHRTQGIYYVVAKFPVSVGKKSYGLKFLELETQNSQIPFRAQYPRPFKEIVFVITHLESNQSYVRAHFFKEGTVEGNLDLRFGSGKYSIAATILSDRNDRLGLNQIDTEAPTLVSNNDTNNLNLQEIESKKPRFWPNAMATPNGKIQILGKILPEEEALQVFYRLKPSGRKRSAIYPLENSSVPIEILLPDGPGEYEIVVASKERADGFFERASFSVTSHLQERFGITLESTETPTGLIPFRGRFLKDVDMGLIKIQKISAQSELRQLEDWFPILKGEAKGEIALNLGPGEYQVQFFVGKATPNSAGDKRTLEFEGIVKNLNPFSVPFLLPSSVADFRRMEFAPLLQDLQAHAGASAFDQVRIVHEWIVPNIHYVEEPPSGFARFASHLTYSQRQGQCIGFSNLGIALLRGFGIPARQTMGRLEKENLGIEIPEEAKSDCSHPFWTDPTASHSWVEFFDGQNWVAWDPQVGVLLRPDQLESSGNPATGKHASQIGLPLQLESKLMRYFPRPLQCRYY